MSEAKKRYYTFINQNCWDLSEAENFINIIAHAYVKELQEEILFLKKANKGILEQNIKLLKQGACCENPQYTHVVHPYGGGYTRVVVYCTGCGNVANEVA